MLCGGCESSAKIMEVAASITKLFDFRDDFLGLFNFPEFIVGAKYKI
jgi:hypothetical protein